MFEPAAGKCFHIHPFIKTGIGKISYQIDLLVKRVNGKGTRHRRFDWKKYNQTFQLEKKWDSFVV